MEKKKFSWTAIDTLIVIVLLIAAAVGAYMLKPMLLGSSAETEKVSFTVLLSSKSPEYSEKITVGDETIISFAEKAAGTIKDVRIEPAEVQVYNSEDGTYSLIDSQTNKDTYVSGLTNKDEAMKSVEKKDIYVTVEADCIATDTAIKIGESIFRVGSSVPVMGKDYAAMGYVIEIHE